MRRAFVQMAVPTAIVIAGLAYLAWKYEALARRVAELERGLHRTQEMNRLEDEVVQ